MYDMMMVRAWLKETLLAGSIMQHADQNQSAPLRPAGPEPQHCAKLVRHQKNKPA
jgi:hypothetical protein